MQVSYEVVTNNNQKLWAGIIVLSIGILIMISYVVVRLYIVNDDDQTVTFAVTNLHAQLKVADSTPELIEELSFSIDERFLNLQSVDVADLKTDEFVPIVLALQSLYRLLNFFYDNARDCNVDAGITMTMVSDQFKVFLRHIGKSASPKLSKDALKALRRDISFLGFLAGETKKIIVDTVKVTEADYYDKLQQLCEDGQWALDYSTRNLDETLFRKRENLIGNISPATLDVCISQMAGKRDLRNKPCLTTNECWDYLTRNNTTDYWLTHQIFFLMIGEMRHCDEFMKKHVARRNQNSTRHLNDVFCTDVFQDMHELDGPSGIELTSQDLFMEQALFCGMLGFRDFFTMKWLRYILSWQLINGCFGMELTISNIINVILGRSINRRRKREEVMMKDSCYSHKSGVAAGALTMYIRYLIENPALQ